MTEEVGSISLYLTARKAYDKINFLDSEMRRLIGKKASSAPKRKKVIDDIKSILSKSVSLCVEATYAELIPQTPKQTKFLVSNWKVSQGRRPSLASLVQPPSDKLSRLFPLPEPISAEEIDGKRVQWIYNQASYARRVAAGFNASGGPIRSGGGPMWFMNVGQKFSSGLYFKTALSTAIAGRR